MRGRPVLYLQASGLLSPPDWNKEAAVARQRALAPSNRDVSLRNRGLPSELSDVCDKHKTDARLSEFEGTQ